MKQKMYRTHKVIAAALAALTAVLSAPTVSALPTDKGGEYNFAKALQYSIYFYDANMCGTEVDQYNRYVWRGNCHTYDAKVPLVAGITDFTGTNLTSAFISKYKDILDPDGDGFIDVAGGFHDAGDHVEFGMPENYAASTLGWGYYEFRDAYAKTGQDNHIETILRCFNDYLMKCTFRDKDGKVIAHCFQTGDGDIDHKFWNSPEVDEMGRPAFFLTAETPYTDYVASAAASLAINYLNFKDTDPDYAEKSLDYATALMDFAYENPKTLSENEDGPKSYYRSSKWEDDYCWACAWMYKITGEHKYLEEIYTCYDYYAAPCYVHCWNDVWGGAQCIIAEITADKPAREGEHVYPDFEEEYKEAAGKSPYEDMDAWKSIEKAVNSYMSGQPGSLTPGGFWWMDTWGSARYNTAGQLIALVYDKYNNDGKPGKFSEWAKGQMEYLMGNNPIKRCYIVGYDESSVKFPHHRACSGLTKCEDPDEHRYVLYGALAGGPGNQDEHNDVTSDWIYNEVTIDYNAAFVGACAGLYEYFGTSAMTVTPDFPPIPENVGGGEEGGGNSYWINACGIDDINADGCGVTKVSFMVMTNSTKPAKDITVRYYFDASEISDINSVKVSELYDQAQTEAAPADGIISGPFKYDKKDNTYYVEVNFDGYTIGNSGKKYQFTVGMYYGDKWDPTNDPSYQELKIYKEDDAFFGTGNEVRNDYICVYSGGEHVGGIEPDGSEPSGTPTVTTTTTTATTTKTTTTKTTTTTTGTTVTTAPGKLLLGDVNCNGEVNVADAVLLARMIAEDKTAAVTDQGRLNADMNQDGSHTDADLSRLLKQLAGKL